MMDQIRYAFHHLRYNIYMVLKFQHAIINKCKVIHKQTSAKDSNSVILTIFDSITKLTSIFFMMDQITYAIHHLHYNIYLVLKFQLAIMNECKVISKQTSDKDLHSVIFDHFGQHPQINFNLFS